MYDMYAGACNVGLLRNVWCMANMRGMFAVMFCVMCLVYDDLCNV